MRHDIYNTARYPYFITKNGAWDIYADSSGYCAAIPCDSASGHKASHFGDTRHVSVTLGVDVWQALEREYSLTRILEA